MLTDQDIQKLNKVLKPQFDSLGQQIDDLAIATAKGFEAVDKRFEQVDKRFDDVDARFEKLEYTVTNLDQRLNEFGKQLSHLSEVIDPLITGYRIMQSEIQSINERLLQVEKKTGLVL